MHKDSSYGLWYDYNSASSDNYELQFMFYNSGAGWQVCDSDFTPDAHTWYHMVGTYNRQAQECKVYINGEWMRRTPGYFRWHGIKL